MQLGIDGKTALITGASSGLGFAAAQALAAEGVQVIINGRDSARLKRAGERLVTAGVGDPILVAADISTEDGRELIRAEVDRIGGVDILVANGGGPPPGPFESTPLAAWQDAGKLLLESAVGLTQVVVGGMKQRGWGRLIYITSVSVLQPIDDLLLSNAYRAAVAGMCKTLSNTHARYGITANCVCPGFTATERLHSLAEKRAVADGVTPDEARAGFTVNVPAQRLGKPEELAALIAFLAGEPAAYITGTAIPVDGGLNRSLI